MELPAQSKSVPCRSWSCVRSSRRCSKHKTRDRNWSVFCFFNECLYYYCLQRQITSKMCLFSHFVFFSFNNNCFYATTWTGQLNASWQMGQDLSALSSFVINFDVVLRALLTCADWLSSFAISPSTLLLPEPSAATAHAAGLSASPEFSLP